MLPFKLKMDPIHWFIYLYSCIGMYRNGENQKFVYLSWDIFTTDLLPNPILQNNFIKKSAKKQHMEKLKVVLSPYWHDVTTVKKSLESKNSAHSDVNSMWNESGAGLFVFKSGDSCFPPWLKCTTLYRLMQAYKIQKASLLPPIHHGHVTRTRHYQLVLSIGCSYSIEFSGNICLKMRSDVGLKV